MIPGGPWGYSMHGASFMPVCKESEACTSAVDKKAPFMTCKCAGEGVGDIPTLEVVDKVKIPKDLPADSVARERRAYDCTMTRHCAKFSTVPYKILHGT